AAKQAAGLAKELGIADINAKKLEKAVKGGGKNASIALKLIADAGKQLNKAYREAEKAADKARQVFDAVKGLYDSVRGAFDSVFDTGEMSQAIADANKVPDSLNEALDTADKKLTKFKDSFDELSTDARQFSWNPNIKAGWQAELDQAKAGVRDYTDIVDKAQKAVDKYVGDAAGAVNATLDAQLQEAATFNAQLNELVARGVDPNAINSLINMGAEAGTELAGVLLNNPALLQKYQDTQNAIAEMGKAQADLQAQYQLDAIKKGLIEETKWQEQYFKKNPLKIKTELKIKLSPKQKRALRALGISPKDLTGRSAQSVTININAPQVDPEATALEISQRLRQIENRTQAPVFT
ncbi:MAG: hypothetical protein GY826_18200, partial [Fuerstiella sp.]|nr:hypothetical protein [Fuerstiella sp.]